MEQPINSIVDKPQIEQEEEPINNIVDVPQIEQPIEQPLEQPTDEPTIIIIDEQSLPIGKTTRQIKTKQAPRPEQPEQPEQPTEETPAINFKNIYSE